MIHYFWTCVAETCNVYPPPKALISSCSVDGLLQPPLWNWFSNIVQYVFKRLLQPTTKSKGKLSQPICDASHIRGEMGGSKRLPGTPGGSKPQKIDAYLSLECKSLMKHWFDIIFWRVGSPSNYCKLQFEMMDSSFRASCRQVKAPWYNTIRNPKEKVVSGTN